MFESINTGLVLPNQYYFYLNIIPFQTNNRFNIQTLSFAKQRTWPNRRSDPKRQAKFPFYIHIFVPFVVFSLCSLWLIGRLYFPPQSSQRVKRSENQNRSFCSCWVGQAAGRTRKGRKISFLYPQPCTLCGIFFVILVVYYSVFSTTKFTKVYTKDTKQNLKTPQFPNFQK